MNTSFETPSSWNDAEPLMVLRTWDGKPYALGRAENDGSPVALATHDYTREQIDWLRREVEQNGGVGSYRGQYRNYIQNVFHGELGLAA